MLRSLRANRGRYLSLLCAVVATSALSSCNDGGPTTGPTTPDRTVSFASDVQTIFDAHCTTCHAFGVFGFNLTGGVDGNGLDLRPGRSYDALVGQTTFERPDVAPVLRVAPGSPEGSYLMQKLTSSSPKEGERMPLDDPPLTPAQIDIIRRWIAGGALNN